MYVYTWFLEPSTKKEAIVPSRFIQSSLNTMLFRSGKHLDEGIDRNIINAVLFLAMTIVALAVCDTHERARNKSNSSSSSSNSNRAAFCCTYSVPDIRLINIRGSADDCAYKSSAIGLVATSAQRTAR